VAAALCIIFPTGLEATPKLDPGYAPASRELQRLEG
jgi:hypothetical protein